MGKKFLEKKNYSRAILEFQNAAQAMPNDAEARYELGLAFTESGDVQHGYENLKRAVELDPKHREAKLRLGQLLSRARDPEALRAGQSELKQLADTSATPEILNSLAVTQLKLGEVGDAVESLQQALKSSPRELNSSILLAIAKLSQKDTSGAEEVLKKACESAPNSADPHIVLGEFYTGQRRWLDGETEFQKALRIDPKKYPALFDLAQAQNANGEKQQAEQSFKQLSDSGEKSYKPVYALFLFNNGKQSEAIAEFEKLFKQDPNDRPTRTRLVLAYEMAHRTADAEAILAKALNKNSSDTDALLQRAALLEASGKYADAEKDLNEVLHAQPTSAETHYLLSKLHKAQGQPLGQRQDLSEAVRLDPKLLAARLELAELLSPKDPKGALEVLDAAPGSQKQSLAVLTQRNWVLWGMGDMAETRKGIDRGLALAKSPDLLVQDGLWKLRSGNSSGGRAALEEALKINPADLRALSGLSQSYVAQKQDAVAVQKVKEYASRQPQSARVQEFLGTMLLVRGDRGGARAAFSAAKAADAHFTDADLSLAEVDILDGKIDDARNRLIAILSTQGSNRLASLWLANIETMKRNYNSAIEQYRKVVEGDPENAQALNNLAYLLAEHGNQLMDALTYAQKAAELAPDKAEYQDTLGWILYRKGLYSEAATELARAASKDSNALRNYHLGMAYIKAGDVTRGRATLQAALKKNPSLPEAKVAQDMMEQAK